MMTPKDFELLADPFRMSLEKLRITGRLELRGLDRPVEVWDQSERSPGPLAVIVPYGLYLRFQETVLAANRAAAKLGDL